MSKRAWSRSTATRPSPRWPTASTKSSPSIPSRPPRTWASGPTSGRRRARRTSGAPIPTVVEMQSRGRRRRRRARRAAGRRADHDLHGVAGPAAHDPQHVQDRGRADLDGASTSRRAPWPRTRSPSSAITPTSWPCRQTGFALLSSRLGAGGARLRAHRPARHAAAAACRSCTSSTASAPRTRCRRSSSSTDDDLRAMIDRRPGGRATAPRALTPDRPVLRGTAQNPDVFFQAREACNPLLRRPARRHVQEAMDKFAELTGRAVPALRLRAAHPDAERVIVIMGSGAETAHETVEYLDRPRARRSAC